MLYRNDDNRYNANNTFIKNGLLHRRTDCRIENTDIIDEQSCKIGQDYVTVFTHEWCMLEQKKKIDKAMALFTSNGYEFVV